MFFSLEILSLSILIFTLGAQIFLRSFGNRAVARFFYFSIFTVFSSFIYFSYQQYFVWLQGEPSKFLLPPYQSINYFLYYVGMRVFAPYIISLLISLLFLLSAKYFNKKYEERFFEPEELWLGALALFLVGWPSALFYFVGLILIYLFFHLLLVISRKSLIKETRISLYYWWIPLAIFVIIINQWLIGLDLWKLLKI